MIFLNPTYLWALLGLVVPVVIHLWSNKEGRTIKLGTVQFLETSDVKQTNSIKLNEFLLLLLRMLIIAFLVFILAEPQIKRVQANAEITYLIEPSLLKNRSYSTMIDSLPQNSSIRLLQPGFPDINTYSEVEIKNPIPNYWQLAKEMEDLPTDSIVVFTNGYLQGVKGKRPKLNKDIAWIVLDAEAQVNEALEVVQKSDEVEVLELRSDQQKLSFKKEKFPLNSESLQFNKSKDSLGFLSNEKQEWFPLKTQDSIAILIHYEEELETTKVLLKSSFNAISNYLERPIEVVDVQDTTGIKWDSYNFLVWLKENPSFKTSQRALIYVPDSLSTSLIEPSAKKHIFHLTKTLTTENVLAENLPEQLLKLLDVNRELDSKIASLDRRTMDVNELSTGTTETISEKSAQRLLSFSKWLWLSLFFLMITERIFSRYRKQ
ncbi:putative membrane protein (TIGR02226 family) [Gillisia sp. Hel_I_86]|uniref:BatA domain-containing protein n=1 Tax=Gillisia sp. Hel_I_86 TaxID=1249981 RepID=UPI00119AF6AE|nr:BatA domain-containing protein [Gillisia sp. Hel_I_86]TVZ27626.1 putative membrane protein (TIGR02226 family) [Gillisia sp. Hel_I_86]